MNKINDLNITDEKWKYLRSKLSPTFTSGKIKQMFRLIQEVADELLKNIDNRLEKNEQVGSHLNSDSK